jgi:hypothetical protein
MRAIKEQKTCFFRRNFSTYLPQMTDLPSTSILQNGVTELAGILRLVSEIREVQRDLN